MEKRRFIMHVSYDEPIYLRKDELKIIMATVVPAHLQWVKDLFVLNCAIGCRISDLLRLTTNNVSTSDDGIPYIHYIPSKTAKLQASNREVTTPLIAPAVDIIDRTGLRLMPYRQHYGKQRYNKALRQLLQYCGITRKVKIYSLDAMANIEKPICDIATSKLARKTHIDMLNKVQINFYVAGLHRPGSDAVYRYTSLELRDRYELLKAAFD
jgi:integrase